MVPALPEGRGIRSRPCARAAIRFRPERWAKVYEHWMTNIQDWCISPAALVGPPHPGLVLAARAQASRSDVGIEPPPDPENWEQDADVLDTWFSSWLWPFETMDARDAREVLPDRRPRHRAGHHLLLGRAHDHGRLRIHAAKFRSECLLHRPDPRSPGAQDVQGARQFARPARPHRKISARTACASA